MSDAEFQVTIVIPTYNRASRIADAIDSVRSQTIRDWELIVVDDGSTDNTAAVVASFQDPRIRWVPEAHRGVSAARNLGIGLSRAPWISFLDSDDRWRPAKLQRQFEVLEAEPQWRAIYTNEIWYRRGRRVNQRRKHRKHSGWIFRYCLPLCIISPSSILLEKSLVREIGRFDESFQVCEDYELWLRLALRHPVRFLDESLIEKVGGHDGQLSHSTWGLDRFRIRALLKLWAGGRLDAEHRAWTAREIALKSQILALGYRNRGKLDEASQYAALAARWASQVPLETSFDEGART